MLQINQAKDKVRDAFKAENYEQVLKIIDAFYDSATVNKTTAKTKLLGHLVPLTSNYVISLRKQSNKWEEKFEANYGKRWQEFLIEHARNGKLRNAINIIKEHCD